MGTRSDKCFWIDCNEPPRIGSKYCSDTCGRHLATLRIKTILPGKVQAFEKNPSVAEANDRLQLPKLNGQIMETRLLLETLEQRRKNLDKFVDDVHQIKYDAELESQEGKSGDDNTTMTCVLCGYEIVLRNYVGHLERCYCKAEKNVIPESKFLTNLPGTKILCEAFDSQFGTYCRRFDAICPDHHKNKGGNKNSKNSVICGSPLTEEMDVKKVCRAARFSCSRHSNWENLRRADIDLQRWNSYLKLDELCRKELQVQNSLKQRRSLLGMLLHSTIPAESKTELPSVGESGDCGKGSKMELWKTIL